VAFVVLTLLRLLSERSLFKLKGKKMNENKHGKKSTTAKSRNFIQYACETIWAVGAGATASSLGS